MATHSYILAWKIPWTEEPGGLQSMVSQSQGWPRLSNSAHTLLSQRKERNWVICSDMDESSVDHIE